MLPDYSEPGSYQAAEVLWYRENGMHPARIRKDGSGRNYVIGDEAWNRGGRPAEFIEVRVQRDLRCR